MDFFWEGGGDVGRLMHQLSWHERNASPGYNFVIPVIHKIH